MQAVQGVASITLINPRISHTSVDCLKRRSCEQDTKRVALLQGAYKDVRDQNKTQARQSIAK